MELIFVTQNIHYRNPVYGKGVLRAGKTYYAYSQFARETARQGSAQIIETNHSEITQFHPSHLNGSGRIKRILLVFAGGLGDAITVGAVFPEAMKKHRIEFDICGDKTKWESIFKPMGLDAEYVPYPPDLETVLEYDAVLTDITIFFHNNDGLKRSPILELCQGFRISEKELKPTYHIPENVRNKLTLPPTKKVRVGVNLDSNGLVKSYPRPLHRQLFQALIQMGCDVYVVGVKRGQQEEYDSEALWDLRSKTNIPELSAILSQMDVVVGVDSFVVHLANLLEVPTTVILSTTTPAYFEWHENIDCLVSSMECSPCFEVFDKCPRDHPECRAFYHHSIRPEIIRSAVAKKATEQFAGIRQV